MTEHTPEKKNVKVNQLVVQDKESASNSGKEGFLHISQILGPNSKRWFGLSVKMPSE